MPKAIRMRSASEALAELEREMDVRARIYRKWVTERKLTMVDATDRFERHLSAIGILREFINASPGNAEHIPLAPAAPVNEDVGDDDVPF